SILKDYQQDPMRGKLVHIDLQEVRLDQPIQATVVVELMGGDEAPGVKEGGVLSQVAREVTVEALPMEVPEHLELDVSGMAIGDTLRLADLAAQEGVKYLDDPETVLATVTLPTRVVALEVQRAARPASPRWAQSRAPEAGDVHERVRPLGGGGSQVLQGAAGGRPCHPRRDRPRTRPTAGALRRRTRRPQRPSLRRAAPADSGLPAPARRSRATRPRRS